MATILPPNQFCSAGAPHDAPPAEEAATPSCSPGVAAEMSHLNLSGDFDEALQALQSTSSIRSIPPQVEASRGTEYDMQNVHKETTPREDEAREKEQQLQQSREINCADEAADCRTVRSHCEARSLSRVSRSDAEASSGWTSQRLFETTSSEMALPQLSRSGASGLASEGGIALSELCARGFDEEKFMFDIGFVPDNFEKYMTLLDQLIDDEPPLFLQRTG